MSGLRLRLIQSARHTIPHKPTALLEKKKRATERFGRFQRAHADRYPEVRLWAITSPQYNTRRCCIISLLIATASVGRLWPVKRPCWRGSIRIPPLRHGCEQPTASSTTRPRQLRSKTSKCGWRNLRQRLRSPPQPYNGMTPSEEISRCDRELQACRKAGGNPELTPNQKLGAILGEIDWLVARQIAEEFASTDARRRA